MSLIGDALDAAQREKARISTSAYPTPAFSTFTSSAKARRGPIPRNLAVAMGVFALVVATGATVSIFTASKRSTIRKQSVDAPPTPPVVTVPIVENIPASVPVDSTYTGGAFPVNDYAAEARRAMDNVPPPRRAPPVALDDDPLLGDEDPLGSPAPATPKPESRGRFSITMQSPQSARQPANDLFQQGIAAQKRGDLVGARNFYQRALAANIRTAELYNNLGTVQRSLGDHVQAENSYRRAIDLEPRFAPAWSNLGVVLETQGRRPEATAALQEALRLDPSNTGTRVNLAIQYFALGLYTDARKHLEDVLRVNPSLAEAHYSLAQVFEKLGDRSQAILRYDMFLTTGAGRFPQLEEQVRRHVANLRANVR